ncbi:MAG: nucleoside-diphosphate sugar epimerase [Solirubrobacterales bacterium]|nr:MAG: nucleoside-diphosphate sugar epimerase [Solirubrobacterales bacterium]
MRYLITGGAGFIGSHLSDALLREGAYVHALDDLSTGSIENIRHLRDHPRFEYTIDTAANARLVAELVDEADVVYHLAAAVGVELIVESPVRTIETNVHCTEVVLSQANKKKRPVLIASTSEVYGKSPALPFTEDGDITLGAPNLGRWAYACSKAIDEFLAVAYWKERKLPTTVARLFNTVGPRQTGRYGMVVPRLTRQALSDQPLTVHGDGSQQRCFCHVSDIVEGLVKLIAVEQAHGEVYNLGSSEEVTILDLARRIIDLTGSGSEVSLISYEDAYGEGFEDMARRVPDTGKIQELIGWRATRSLDDIILDVIDAQRSAPSV